jgi:hypothetical protein
MFTLSAHPRDRGGSVCSTASFELAAPAGRQLVELRPAVVLRRAPFGFEPAAHLEPVQRRIQRALFDAQHVVRRLLDVLGDRVAVHGATADRLQHQHVESAWQKRRLELGLSHN